MGGGGVQRKSEIAEPTDDRALRSSQGEALYWIDKSAAQHTAVTVRELAARQHEIACDVWVWTHYSGNCSTFSNLNNQASHE